MRSIVYAGHDFSRHCSAEVVARAANTVVAEALAIPGRAGARLGAGYVPPVDVTVALFMDVGFAADVVELAEIRHTLAHWLCVPGGGELVLPDEPEHRYRDALLVDVTNWTGLFSDGRCEATFTLFDPIAYGAERVEREGSFEVGGTWDTLPRFELTAAAGDAVAVTHVASGRTVRVEHPFDGGESVLIDCADESVTIDGSDARARVALGTDFFALKPGGCELRFSGCQALVTRFCERWA